jgi:hypothetical protein
MEAAEAAKAVAQQEVNRRGVEQVSAAELKL